MMQFSKEYWLPSKDGETPEIESLGGDGPELSDTETLKYFSDKLMLASKIPFNRFNPEEQGTYEIAADGMLRDEIKFSKFINRLRSIWEEILVKPLYIQMVLDHPELEDDYNFKSNLSIKFNKENVFEEMKMMELATRRIDFIQNVRDGLIETDEDMNDVPYFNLDYLVSRFGGFTQDELKANRRYKEIAALEKEGYSREDAEKIAEGEPKSKFKKKETEPEGEDDLDLDI
jgi:hypothetical protein